VSGRKTWWNLIKKDKTDKEKDEEFAGERELEEDFENYEADLEEMGISDPDDLLEGKKEEKAGFATIEDAFMSAFVSHTADKMEDLEAERKRILETMSDLEDPEDIQEGRLRMYDIDNRMIAIADQAKRLAGSRAIVASNRGEVFSPDKVFSRQTSTEDERILQSIQETLRQGYDNVYPQMRTMIEGAFLLKAGEISNVIDEDGIRYNWRDPQAQLRRYLWRRHKLFKYDVDRNGQMVWIPRKGLEDEDMEEEMEKLKRDEKAASVILHKFAQDLPPGLGPDHLLSEMTRIIPMFIMDPELATALGTEIDEFDEVDFYDEMDRLHKLRARERGSPENQAGIDKEIERLQQTSEEEGERRYAKARQGAVRGRLMAAMARAMDHLEATVIQPARSYQNHKQKSADEERFRQIIEEGNLPNLMGIGQMGEGDRRIGLSHGFASYPPQIFDLSLWGKGNFFDVDELVDTDGERLLDLKEYLGLGDSFDKSHFIRAIWQILEQNIELEDDQGRPTTGDSRKKQMKEVLDSVVTEGDDGEFSFNPILMDNLTNSWSQRHGGGCACSSCGQGDPSQLIASRRTDFPLHHPQYDQGYMEARGLKEAVDVINMSHKRAIAQHAYEEKDLRNRLAELRSMQNDTSLTASEALALAAEMDDLGQQLDSDFSLEAQSELFDIEDAEHLYHSFELPRSDELQDMKDKIFSQMGLMGRKEMGSSRMQRALVRMPYGDLEKKMQAIFSEQEGDVLPEWRDKQTSSHDYTDTIEYLKFQQALLLQLFDLGEDGKISGAASENHWKELGAPEGFAKWLVSESDLYKRTQEMYEALLDCTPTYEYDIKSNWSHDDKAGVLMRRPGGGMAPATGMRAMTGMFYTPPDSDSPELRPNMLDDDGRIDASLISGIFAPGVSPEQTILGKYPGVTSKREPTGWKYGGKMKALAKQFGMDPEALRILLQDDSDTGIFEQHVMLANMIDELGHMTKGEPLVSGEERSSQFEMDEKTSPISPKKVPWPAELLNEAYQTAWDKDEEGEVRKVLSEPRWDPKKRREVQTQEDARKVIGGKGPLFGEQVEPKKTKFDRRTVIDLQSGNRKRPRKENMNWDTMELRDEYGRLVMDSPHVSSKGVRMTPDVILKVIQQTEKYTRALNQRMENLWGVPVATSIGHVQPYEMFPVAAGALQHGLPHHIDANQKLTDQEKEDRKHLVNSIFTGSMPDWMVLPIVAGDKEKYERWSQPDFINGPEAYKEIIKTAWDIMTRVDGKGLGFDVFEEDDSGNPLFATRAFQENDALAQLFDSITYDVLDCLVNPKTRLERMRKMFGVEMNQDGHLIYTTRNQGPTNVTGGKSRCSGPIGLSCAGDGHVNYDDIRQYLIYEGVIPTEAAKDEEAEREIIEKALEEGSIRHYGDSDEGWLVQAKRESIFSNIPIANVGSRNLRYSCPYCDGHGVCKPCDGDTISQLPSELEQSFLSMFLPVIDRHLQSETARVARQFPGVHAQPDLGQSVRSFCEEQKIGELLDDDVDLDQLRKDRLDSTRDELLAGVVRKGAPDLKDTSDPYRHVRTARAARASTSETRYKQSIKDDANRQKYMEGYDDRTRKKDLHTLRNEIQALEDHFHVGKMLPLARYFGSPRMDEDGNWSNVKDWGWDIYPEEIQDKVLEDGKRRGLKPAATKKEFLDKQEKYMLAYAARGKELGASQKALELFKRAHDMITNGQVDSLSEFQARMQHRVDKKAMVRVRSQPTEDYDKYQRYAANSDILKGGRRWSGDGGSPYQWISGVAGYLTPPWDSDTSDALLQAERVYRLTGLMEELKTFAMHHPSNYGKLGEWKKAIRLANFQTAQTVQQLQEELATLEGDEWHESHTKPEENWWQTQLRQDFMVECMKERIALLRDVMSMREEDANKESYKQLLNQGHMKDEKAWEMSRDSLLGSLKPLLMRTSSLGDEDYLFSSGLSDEFDLDMPEDLEGFVEKMSSVLSTEVESMNSLFKESPFDYQSEIKQMVEASEEAHRILNDPKSTPAQLEKARKTKEDCRYSVMRVKGPHSVHTEGEINPMTGREFADGIYLDEFWVWPRVGNQSIMEQAGEKFAEKTGIENPMKNKRKQKALDDVLEKQEVVAVLRDRLEQFLAPVYALANNLGEKPNGQPYTVQDIAILSQDGFTDRGYGPEWLFSQLSELDRIPRATRDEYGNLVMEDQPWDSDSLFDMLEQDPIAHRVIEMGYSNEWHEQYNNLCDEYEKASKEDSTSSKTLKLGMAISDLLDQPKDTEGASGYSYHPLFGIRTFGEQLMDNHGFYWNEPNSPQRRLITENSEEDGSASPFYELKSEPMNLTTSTEDGSENTFSNPYFTISLALAVTSGTPTPPQVPSRIKGQGEDEGESVVSWTPQPGGMLNHHQKKISSQLQKHWEEMAQWDASTLLRMHQSGDIDLTDEQVRGLQDRIALWHHGMNLSAVDLSDPNWFLAAPNFSELDMLEMQREQEKLNKERRRLHKQYETLSPDSEEAKALQERIDDNSNATRALQRKTRLPDGFNYRMESIQEPAFSSGEQNRKAVVGDTPQREEDLQDFIDGKPVRRTIFDKTATAVPMGIDPETGVPIRWEGLSPWAEAQVTGKEPDPALSDTWRGKGSLWTQPSVDRMKEGQDLAVQQEAARKRPGAYVLSEGDPKATLLQEQERSKLEEEEKIEVPGHRDVEREKSDAKKVYEGLEDEKVNPFQSQGQLDARKTGQFLSPTWDERMERRPRLDDEDDEVATSYDDPIDFAFRILKNIV